MRIIPQKITDLASKAFNKAKEYSKPKVEVAPDDQRIERELSYMRRLHQASPTLKALQERRIKASRRRSL